MSAQLCDCHIASGYVCSVVWLSYSFWLCLLSCLLYQLKKIRFHKKKHASVYFCVGLSVLILIFYLMLWLKYILRRYKYDIHNISIGQRYKLNISEIRAQMTNLGNILRYRPDLVWSNIEIYARCTLSVSPPSLLFCRTPRFIAVIKIANTGRYSEPHELSKGKAIPLQAWTGPDSSRSLRLLDFMTIGTWRW
jgi:hypothetical protein